MWTVKDTKTQKVSVLDVGRSAKARASAPTSDSTPPPSPVKPAAAPASKKRKEPSVTTDGSATKKRKNAKKNGGTAPVPQRQQQSQKIAPVPVEFNRIPWKPVRPHEGFMMGDDQAPGGFLSLEEIDGVDVEYETGLGGGKMISFKKVKESPEPEEVEDMEDIDLSSFMHIDDFVEGEGSAEEANSSDDEEPYEEGVEEEDVDMSADEEENVLDLDVPSEDEAVEPVGKGGKVFKASAAINATPAPVEEEDENMTADMSAWEALNLEPVLLKGLQALKFTTPSEIQAKTLPTAMKGDRDVIGAAQTGSGKTLAFGLPILQSIAQRVVTSKDPGLHALILTPTRELAMQVTDHLKKAAKFMPTVRVVSIVGGMSIPKQKRQLSTRPDIIVATPGRLWELAGEDDSLLLRLRNIKFLCIDEADRMLEAGHFKDLDNILGAISMKRRDKPTNLVRRTFIFSATLVGNSKLKQKLKTNKKKQGSGPSLSDLLTKIEFADSNPLYVNCLPEQVTADGLLETRIDCLHTEKDAFLYYILMRYPGRTIVFVNSIDAIRRLVPVLTHMRVKAFGLHAEMQQRQRLKNLDRFKDATDAVLIASDVAARGLDIPGIEHVIHYQLPRSADLYVHRSGRTARAAEEGVSVMLCSPQEVPVYKKICNVLKKTDGIPEFPVDRALLAGIKIRMNLAKKIDEIEHKKQKKAHEKGWFEKAAEEMDVELDLDFIDGRKTGDNDTDRTRKIAADQAGKVKGMKAQLNELLGKDLVPKGISGNYLTSNVDEGLADTLIKAGATKSKMPTQRQTNAAQEIKRAGKKAKK
ncbi:ATP-dependent RNA helicase [Thoreauomyces humboldtii]|nr:ATP-dependent RNA helicase [Thoreauomyces humboldtii]